MGACSGQQLTETAASLPLAHLTPNTPLAPLLLHPPPACSMHVDLAPLLDDMGLSGL